MDPTDQTENMNSSDWQEEIYQKIKTLKEAYLPELNEMYLKIAGKLQQHDNLPQQPKNDKVEKLKVFKSMLERFVTFLQLPKNNIVPAFKDKLGRYEKQIINFLNSNRPRKLGPTMQQPQQIPTYHMMQQQSQISQGQPRENSMSSQVQPMNVQASLDSTDQTENMNGGDWQEEIYHKIKTMKEAYLPELNEMYWKVVGKLQQHDNLPQQPNNDQVEKLKVFKELLERIISFLQVPKNNIVPALKEKLGGYEKLIINFLNSNSPRKLGPTMQQPQQIPAYHMQQQQSQISQVQPRENSMGSQVRPMDVQGSVNTLQQNNIASLQHNSSSSLLGVPNASHDIMDSLQSNSNVDSGHENPPNTMQQVDVGMQQSVSAPQQPAQGVAEPIMDIGDWRADLQQESRQRMVYRIIDTLKMGVLDFGPEGLEETEKIGARFEESIYNTATSQSDYMRKISLKMLAMGSFFQNTVVDSLPYDSASNGQDLEDAVSAIPFS